MTTGTAEGVTGSRVPRGPAALAAAVTLTAAARGDRAGGGYAQGDAIALPARASFRAGCAHARVGAEYWVSTPLPENGTAEPLTVPRTRVLRVPRGLEVVRYGTVTLRQGRRPRRRGHRRSACRTRPAVRGRPAPPGRRLLPGSRQGHRARARHAVRLPLLVPAGAVEHPQDVGCETDVRLGPSLGGA